jgi:uncharacterized membrane protein
MLGAAREAAKRDPHPGRRDRAEPLANPTRFQRESAVNHMHQEVRIEAPVEHVWAFYCDTSHWPDWMPRGKCSDFTGPVDRVGTTYVETMRLMGFEMKSTSKVVEVEPLRLIHEHTDNGPMESYLRFEPDGEATRLVFDSDWEMPGHWPGFIKDLVNKGWADQNIHQMLSDFKALAEANVPVPA